MRAQLAAEAELAVLGAALADEQSCRRMLARLSAEDFKDTDSVSEAPNRRLYRLIAEAHRNGSHGPVAVLDVADRTGTDIRPADVFDLAGTIVAPDGLSDRIETVAEAGYRRRMFQAGTDIRQAAQDFSVPADQLTGHALQAMTSASLGHETRAGIRRAADLTDDVVALHEGRNDTWGVTCGWGSMDEVYRPKKSRWTVVTGIPGHGKSSWCDHLAVNLAEQHGWRTVFCSPEKVPIAEHVGDLIAIRADMPFYPDGKLGGMSDDMRDETLKWIDHHFAWVLPDRHSRTLESILALIRLVDRTSPVDAAIIDPWNELEHSRPPQLSEHEYISRSLTTLREFSRRLDIHIWLVAHPTKMSKNRTSGTYPVPTPYDISGAAAWRNKADNAVTIWRDPSRRQDPVQIHVQKVRRQPWEGTEGRVDLHYDTATGRYVDPKDDM